jgi:hypothetical protein
MGTPSSRPRLPKGEQRMTNAYYAALVKGRAKLEACCAMVSSKAVAARSVLRRYVSATIHMHGAGRVHVEGDAPPAWKACLARAAKRFAIPKEGTSSISAPMVCRPETRLTHDE